MIGYDGPVLLCAHCAVLAEGAQARGESLVIGSVRHSAWTMDDVLTACAAGTRVMVGYQEEAVASAVTLLRGTLVCGRHATQSLIHEIHTSVRNVRLR